MIFSQKKVADAYPNITLLIYIPRSFPEREGRSGVTTIKLGTVVVTGIF